MATLFSHGIAAIAIGSSFSPRLLPRSLWVVGVFCAIFPDSDVLGMALGVEYEDFWGHRGFTHSLLFAVMLSALFAFIILYTRSHKILIFIFLCAATASHGILDALTDGGLGVAFFSPFNNERYFFPYTPISVSPIGVDFFKDGGIEVLKNEFVWIWIPSLAWIFAWSAMYARMTKIDTKHVPTP